MKNPEIRVTRCWLKKVKYFHLSIKFVVNLIVLHQTSNLKRSGFPYADDVYVFIIKLMCGIIGFYNNKVSTYHSAEVGLIY